MYFPGTCKIFLNYYPLTLPVLPGGTGLEVQQLSCWNESVSEPQENLASSHSSCPTLDASRDSPPCFNIPPKKHWDFFFSLFYISTVLGHGHALCLASSPSSSPCFDTPLPSPSPTPSTHQPRLVAGTQDLRVTPRDKQLKWWVFTLLTTRGDSADGDKWSRLFAWDFFRFTVTQRINFHQCLLTSHAAKVITPTHTHGRY